MMQNDVLRNIVEVECGEGIRGTGGGEVGREWLVDLKVAVKFQSF